MSQTRPGIKKYKQPLYLPLKQSNSKISSNNFRYLQMISVGPVDFVCEFYESFSLQVTRDGLDFCNSGNVNIRRKKLFSDTILNTIGQCK